MITTCEEHGTDAVVVFKNFISCPFCKEVERGDELEREVGDLESEVRGLDSSIDTLESRVDELREEIADLESQLKEKV